MSRVKIRRSLALCATVALVALGACGDDDDAIADAAGDPAESSDDDAESPSGSDDGDSGDATSEDGGDPVGTATIDGTAYTVIADLQCLVAIDEANQISISGTVQENPSEERVEFSYAWDSDDDVNEFRINVSDEVEYFTFDGQADFGEPQVDGKTVTASGMLLPNIGELAEASFEIDCAG
ncbi:MAG: hypothetical protein ACSLFO_01020 [Acidimicrobiales bacterium]